MTDVKKVEMPSAYSFELATAKKDDQYCNWQEHISRNVPRVPDGAMRNLVPLYTRAAPTLSAEDARKFKLGDRVTKIKGSQWTGKVVGFYSTELTPIGYAVESETEKGSVQIYPENALSILGKVGANG